MHISDRIRAVCLPLDAPLKDERFMGTQPFVIGWGRQTESGDSATILQQVQIKIKDNGLCRAAAKRSRTFISEKQFGDNIICAGVLAGGIDSCKGDSGGPLMMPIQQNKTTRVYQLGIVSWANGCGRENSPGIYTRIGHYVDWIKHRVNNE